MVGVWNSSKLKQTYQFKGSYHGWFVLRNHMIWWSRWIGKGCATGALLRSFGSLYLHAQQHDRACWCGLVCRNPQNSSEKTETGHPSGCFFSVLWTQLGHPSYRNFLLSVGSPKFMVSTGFTWWQSADPPSPRGIHLRIGCIWVHEIFSKSQVTNIHKWV